LSAIRSKFLTRLIGYKVGAYLLLEWPKLSGALVRIEEGTTWACSFINSGVVFGFTGLVLGATRSPVPLIFLEYPAAVEQTNLRQEKRIPVNLDVTLSARSGNGGRNQETVNGLIRDISAGGCQVITTEECTSGATVELMLRLPEQDPIQGLQAEVKSCQRLGGNYLLGLRFLPGEGSAGRRRLQVFLEGLKAMPLRL
ncbi:MAG: flagellar brake protein, partial [Thermodesulfobacteriota bacterium]